MSTWRGPDRWDVVENPAVAVVVSQPRLTFSAQAVSIMRALQGIETCGVVHGTGTTWEAGMHQGIGVALTTNPDYILFVDYDSVFTPDDAKALIRVLQDHPEYATAFPIQASRHHDGAMVEKAGLDYSGPLTEVESGHFGLTLVRADLFREMPKPWFWAMPNPETYEFGAANGGMDADIMFWQLCWNFGVKAVRLNDVQIGHLELCSYWVGKDGKRLYQPINDWMRHGRPAEASWRGPVK